MLDNKKKSGLPLAIKDVIIIGAVVAGIWAVIYFGLATGNPFYVVSSGSMEPNLKKNDVLVVRDGGSFGELRVGEIIVFNKPEGGDRVIVHRIVNIDGEGDSRVIRTKGDANPGSIPGVDYPIREKDFIGRVVFVIPGIGLVTEYLKPPVNYIIIAVILGVLFYTRMGSKNDGSSDSNSSKDKDGDASDKGGSNYDAAGSNSSSSSGGGNDSSDSGSDPSSQAPSTSKDSSGGPSSPPPSPPGHPPSPSP